MANEIETFTRAFFTNLGANLEDKGKILLVANVPESFEKFYGKKSPYQIIFESSNEQFPENKEIELMVKGSFMLNCMKEFLENKGQTTILKLDFNFNPLDEIKKNFILRNCSLENITKKIDNKYLIRFTFLTNLQYLNEKEQLSNSIYVSQNSLVDFKLEDYTFSEGKKEDIQFGDIKVPYSLAKEKLKILLEPKIAKTGEMLDLRLKKEIERIKQHYLIEHKEINDNIAQLNKQLDEAKKQLEKFRLQNKTSEIPNSELKIKKIEESKKQLENSVNIDKLNKEEAFFVNDETYKHSLNISTKLMNTSIIYYPIFTFSGFLKNKEVMRIIEIKYNPLKKEFSELSCDCCKNLIKDINLCSGGHVSCKNCLRGCSLCQKDYCNHCLKDCFSCGKRICKKCSKQCRKCNKSKCNSHFNSLGICTSCG